MASVKAFIRVSSNKKKMAHPDFSVADLHRPCMTA